ncbi:Acetyltransferase, putative [Fructilactobacillus florum 8D]|uniref:Acetyltransferase, putative n=1 Tax=Fructilactobacillus florum 8D TaxID=1221538 RepID=W9EMB6_9LACO|nr:GNAT family N-acetyltransferase [Fructilactobacillus florum]EKK20580.1 Acetyltransferase, putative [Fructilactobacillus florum 2F]ETO40814.1 Acetyltransferase, putative [Fructilactobacillus florum 8D]
MKLVTDTAPFSSQLQAYRITNPEFTTPPITAIERAHRDQNQHPVLLINDANEVCTFLMLDTDSTKDKYTENPHSILLKSFSTNERFLRHGYAQATLDLLPGYLSTNYPTITELVLGVNQRNQAAQHLYQKAGFTKTGQVISGPNGPLLVFTKSLS